MNTEHTIMVIRRGKQTEIVGRPGHTDLRTAADFAARHGGKLVVVRHLRQPAGAPQPELVRIIQGEVA